MYSVYMHILPNKKRYVGITSSKPEKRWGREGRGYKSNKEFYADIELYGWDNIKHVIVSTNLSLDKAVIKEVKLISKYNLTNLEYGYNKSIGGISTRPRAKRKVLKKVKLLITDTESKIKSFLKELYDYCTEQPEDYEELTPTYLEDMTLQIVTDDCRVLINFIVIDDNKQSSIKLTNFSNENSSP